MEYAGRDIHAASAATLGKVAQLGGDGGVIVLDRAGNVAMDFNSSGMYRGAKIAGRPEVIAIFGDEPRR
jgi:L-asparaginase / beta-aspartyl-peptidase